MLCRALENVVLELESMSNMSPFTSLHHMNLFSPSKSATKLQLHHMDSCSLGEDGFGLTTVTSSSDGLPEVSILYLSNVFIEDVSPSSCGKCKHPDKSHSF